MRPIIISFFTVGTGYEDQAAELEASCLAFGLLTDIRSVPDLGSWRHNCGHKPAFIRDRMRDYSDRPIVWLDADARVKSYPALFDSLTCDFAAHWRWGAELLSGTMFFGPTDGAKRLVDAWRAEQNRTPDVLDQDALRRVIESGIALKMDRLPSAYTRIFDAVEMGEVVIEHGQFSRRIRRPVGRR